MQVSVARGRFWNVCMIAGAGGGSEAAGVGAVSDHLCLCGQERGGAAHVQGAEAEDLGGGHLIRAAGDLWHGTRVRWPC